jgi:BON domain
MRNAIVAALLLAGCAHGGNRDFARQYDAVATGRQLTARSGPLVMARVDDRTVQVTDERTSKEQLQPVGPDRAAQLKDSVQATVAGDGKLKHDRIQVNADPSGVVTLAGRVESQSHAARAVLDAFSVPGVHVVNTDLR